MLGAQHQVCSLMVFVVTISLATLNVKAEDERTSQNTELYGETGAEELGELSILDVLFRKRRDGGCNNNAHEKVDEIFYEKVEDDPITGNETEVSIEQVEIVSYEEIVSSGDEEHTNSSPVVEYLKPPAENANCTNYGENHENNTTEDIEKTLAVDPASGTVLAT